MTDLSVRLERLIAALRDLSIIASHQLGATQRTQLFDAYDNVRLAASNYDTALGEVAGLPGLFDGALVDCGNADVDGGDEDEDPVSEGSTYNFVIDALVGVVDLQALRTAAGTQAIHSGIPGSEVGVSEKDLLANVIGSSVIELLHHTEGQWGVRFYREEWEVTHVEPDDT